jgi:hypothetical protein
MAVLLFNGFREQKRIPNLKVKFDRAEVQNILKVGEDESIVITG